MIDGSQEVLIALFETRADAELAQANIASANEGNRHMEVLAPGDESRLDALAETNTGAAVKEIATGTALGALGGAGGAVIAGLTILATGPVAAALVGAGIGAGAGAVGAAASSSSLHRPILAQSLREALAAGRYALLIGVDGEREALEMQDVLEHTAAMKVIDRHGGQHGVRKDVG